MQNRRIADVIAGKAIVTAAPTTSIRDVAKHMCDARVGAVMIVEDSKLIGIFTERDALSRVLVSDLVPENVAVSEVMTRDPMTIAPDHPLGHALHMMFEGGYRHVPVVQNGVPVGMISARDALGSEITDFEGELVRRQQINEIL